jgi:uncharacterized phage protein gp47/JayE
MAEERIFEYKQYRQIKADMTSRFIAAQDKISDFNDGSVTDGFLETASIEIADFYMRVKTGFDRYLQQLAFSVFGFERKSGLYAAGAVVFSRNEATPEAITIPSGTTVSTDSGIEFTTQESGTIAGDETASGSVAIRAVEVGVDGNVPADSVTTVVSTIPGVTGVTNAVALSGGQDTENDADYSRRFQMYLLGLGGANKYGILSAVLSLPSVRSVAMVEHFPPLSGLYNFSLYVDDGAGQAPSSLVDEVELILFGDETETNPGKIAAGLNARVLGPTAVYIDVTAEITSDGRYPDEILLYNVEEEIRTYINNLELGQDVVVNRIRQVIMRVAGVYDFDLTVPAANTIIADDQIARFGTPTLTMAV